MDAIARAIAGVSFAGAILCAALTVWSDGEAISHAASAALGLALALLMLVAFAVIRLGDILDALKPKQIDTRSEADMRAKGEKF